MNPEVFRNGDESGIGLPHSTTLAPVRACYSFREVVECGSPMPLSRLDFGIRSTQPSIRRQPARSFCKGLRLSSFDFRYCFEFRISIFELPAPWNAS
jgi:hypothetical protein